VEIKYNNKVIKKPLFKQTFLLLFLLGVADFVANSLYLYWTVWWFDIIMHFSAGVCVGMASILVWQYFLDGNISFKKSLVLALFFSLLVGLLWEFFEVYFGIALVSDGVPYITDTISDMILDVCGGLLGGIYAHRAIFK
jgi:hypothetical protein